MKPVEVNVNFFYPLETSENHRLFMFPGGTNGKIDRNGLNSNNIGERGTI